MDLSFGKGEGAVGGILIRAINSVGALNGKHLPPNDFVEGPCNTVQRIFEHSSPAGSIIKEVKDYVVLPGFSTNAFSESNLHYLLPVTKLPTSLSVPWAALGSPLWKGPRVGLTLNKYDDHKPRFWMAEYRYVVYPEKHRKQQILIMLGMFGPKHKLSLAEVSAQCKLKQLTVI
jgi:hypothetical protein